MSSQMIEWKILRFEQLTTMQLYQLLALRVEVFVVEQTCYYQELDGKDFEPQTHHVMGTIDEKVVAYTRVLAPGVSYNDYASIGRVIVDKSCRGMNVGNDLMERSMALTRQLWSQTQVKISAQQPLETFYNQFGFHKASAMYLEDDIPHIAMITSV